MLANLVWKFLPILLVFSAQSGVTFAEDAKKPESEGSDSWDAEGDDLEDDLDDQWDNSGDAEPMENALPASVFATIFLSEQDTIPGVMEFGQKEVQNYPTVNLAQTGESPALLRFFKSSDESRAYAIVQAIENDKVPEEMKAQLEEARKTLPDLETILAYPIESIDVSEMDVDEIRGLLADHNVHRNEQVQDDDDDFETEDDDEVVLGENDGNTGGRRKKTRVDWRKRREARKKEQSEKKKESGAKPLNSIGSGVPTPILVVLCLVGLAGFGYIIFALFETLRTSEEEADLKKLKSQRKSEKRMKRDKLRAKKRN